MLEATKDQRSEKKVRKDSVFVASGLEGENHFDVPAAAKVCSSGQGVV